MHSIHTQNRNKHDYWSETEPTCKALRRVQAKGSWIMWLQVTTENEAFGSARYRNKMCSTQNYRKPEPGLLLNAKD